jgi:kumamolisin
MCSGGGGGISIRYARPTFQDHLPGAAPRSMRTVPDIAALAGFPRFATYLPPDTPGDGWTWVANGGDSLSGPMYAGAFASMLTALRRQGIEPPISVNELLYEIASDPTSYATVFRDVTEGDNATHAQNRPPIAASVLYPAAEGYDLASGLGEVRMGALLAVLERSTVPTFTG